MGSQTKTLNTPQRKGEQQLEKNIYTQIDLDF